MAGHALYGIAPYFGHTEVTFDAENFRPGPGSLLVILWPPEAVFFETEGFVLTLYIVNGKIVTQHGYTTLLLSNRNTVSGAV